MISSGKFSQTDPSENAPIGFISVFSLTVEGKRRITMLQLALRILHVVWLAAILSRRPLTTFVREPRLSRFVTLCNQRGLMILSSKTAFGIHQMLSLRLGLEHGTKKTISTLLLAEFIRIESTFIDRSQTA